MLKKNKMFAKTVLLCFLLLFISGCKNPNNPNPKPVEYEYVRSIKNTVSENYISLDKPVIYLYGYDDTEVEVNLDLDGEITCSYPQIKNNRWVVIASEDGKLSTLDGKEYNYLYWEGKTDAKFTFDKGFCVRGSDTASFFEKELDKLGLNDTEINDFITYWLPRMQDNKYNVISFQTKAYSSVAKLSVIPKPDKVLRIFMAYYPSDTEIDIPAQNFSVPKRSGKVVVEWGGAEVDPSSKKSITYEDKINEATRLIEGIEETSNFQNGHVEGNLIVLDISDPGSAALLQQQQMLYVQRQMLNGGTGQIMSTTPTSTNLSGGGHPFTDKNGAKTTFTDAEWKKLQSVWAYTGAADEMISHHTISELRQVLNTM